MQQTFFGFDVATRFSGNGPKMRAESENAQNRRRSLRFGPSIPHGYFDGASPAEHVELLTN